MADEVIRRAQPWLGTLVEIVVPACNGAAVDLAFAQIADIHRLMSFHTEDSDLARLRRAAPGETIEVDARTAHVLREAKRLHALSGGLFDVSIAPALIRWGYLPRPPGIDLRRYRNATLDDLDIVAEQQIRQRRPLLLDLGGIAKGYAVDCAVDALRAVGVVRGLVNAGGDLRVFGAFEAPVALRAPDWSGIVETRMLKERALASSANADRRRLRGAASPHVGRARKPILSDCLAVVEAPTALLADALTKVVLADASVACAMATRLGAQTWRLANAAEQAVP